MDNKEKISKLKQYFDELKDFGYKMQHEGNFWVRVSEEGGHVLDSFDPKAVTLGGNEQILLDRLYEETTRAPIPSSSFTPPGLYIVSATTASACAFSADNFKTYGWSHVTKGRSPEDIAVYRGILKELDSYLNKFRQTYKIYENLVNKRKGAWSALDSSSPDKFSQAANSMRQIISKFISIIAPRDKIVAAPWYLANPDAWKSGDSLLVKAKIRYLLFGSEEDMNQSLMQDIEKLLTVCNEDYDILQKVAHGSECEKERLEKVFMRTEFLLVVICRARMASTDTGI